LEKAEKIAAALGTPPTDLQVNIPTQFTCYFKQKLSEIFGIVQITTYT